MNVILTMVAGLFIFFVSKANALEIAGKEVTCSHNRLIVDNRLENEGMSDGRNIVINKKLLRQFSPEVQWFIFYHECGHSHVGRSELKADCWAIREGKRQGWLKEEHLKPICDSWEDAPATATHPSARRRCSNISMCFKETSNAGVSNK